jgi:hypothetical protein
MRHSAIAPSGARTSSSNVKGRLWLGITAPEPNRRRNLRSHESLELAPIGLTR